MWPIGDALSDGIMTCPVPNTELMLNASPCQLSKPIVLCWLLPADPRPDPNQRRQLRPAAATRLFLFCIPQAAPCSQPLLLSFFSGFSASLRVPSRNRSSPLEKNKTEISSSSTFCDGSTHSSSSWAPWTLRATHTHPAPNPCTRSSPERPGSTVRTWAAAAATGTVRLLPLSAPACYVEHDAQAAPLAAWGSWSSQGWGRVWVWGRGIVSANLPPWPRHSGVARSSPRLVRGTARGGAPPERIVGPGPAFESVRPAVTRMRGGPQGRGPGRPYAEPPPEAQELRTLGRVGAALPSGAGPRNEAPASPPPSGLPAAAAGESGDAGPGS
ncbi:hypothetical protein H8959_019169 [Pygathrix nigripes]